MAKLYHAGEYLEGNSGGTSAYAIPVYTVDIYPTYELENMGRDIVLENFDYTKPFHLLIRNLGEYNACWSNNLKIRAELNGTVMAFNYSIVQPYKLRASTHSGDPSDIDMYYDSYNLIEGQFPISKGAMLELISTKAPEFYRDSDYINGTVQLLTSNGNSYISGAYWFVPSSNHLPIYTNRTFKSVNPFVLVTSNCTTHNKNKTSFIEDPTTTLTIGVVTRSYYTGGMGEVPAINQMPIIGNVTLKYIKSCDWRTFKETSEFVQSNGPVIYDFYISESKNAISINFFNEVM